MVGLILRGVLTGLLLTFTFASLHTSHIVETAPGVYNWNIQVPSVTQISLDKNGVEFPEWNMAIDQRGYKLPVISKLVYTNGAKPIVNVTVGPSIPMNSDQPFASIVERAKGMEYAFEPYRSSKIEHITHTIDLISDAGDQKLWSVSVYGAQIHDDLSSVMVPDGKIVVQISTDIPGSSKPEKADLYVNSVIEKQMLGKQTTTGLGSGRVKFHVLENGIYRIDYDLIHDLLGDAAEGISSRSLRLFNKGEEQPIFVSDGRDGLFDEDDFFDFIGKQNYFSGSSQYYDPFSDVNVYWLDWGSTPGLRFVEESGALVSTNPVQPKSFWDVAHIEKDILFDRLGRVDTDKPTITRDHYFWSSVNSGQNVEVDFFLPDPARGSSENIEIEIGLHGLTYSGSDGSGGDHTIFAFLNDNSIGEASWQQQEEYTLQSPSSLNLSHNILSSSGDNRLAVFAPVSTQAGVYDRVVVNWVEIAYERQLTAHEDRLRFRKSHLNPSTNLEYELTGFNSPNMVIYKEALSKITGYQIREVWDSQGQSFNLVFQDEASGATPDYWVSSVDSLHEPTFVIADTLKDLRNRDGDFIIITTPGLMGEFESYMEFKVSEGWNPILVSLSDIVDEFNYGIKSPFAIKAFLKYANNNWPSEPSHVMLVGDATINPFAEKQDIELKNVPTFYMQTHAWGAAEADYWYTLINGDDYIPDLSIGRLPVGDKDELQVTLDKLVRYQSDLPYGAWQNEVVTIAGFETTFKSQSENLLKSEIPRSIMPSRLFIDRNSEGDIFWGDTDSLIDLWNEGKLLINFLGHGGGAVWADRSLFVREDVDLLDVEAPPALVTSMTCFTGSFAQTEGLGEVILSGSPSGAIGWFGSSGVGWMINDYLMIQPMLRRLLEQDKTIGELMNIARIEYFIAPAATASDGTDLRPSMLFQYNYLGDPTTKLRLPEKEMILESISDIYDPQDTIRIDHPGNDAGELKVLPVNAGDKPWWTHPQVQNVSGGETISFLQEELIYNSDSSRVIQPKSGDARTIFTLDRGPDLPAIQGFVPYSINAEWFEHEPFTADELENNKSPTFRSRFHSDTDTADSLTITFSGGVSGSYDLTKGGVWWETMAGLSLYPTDRKSYYYFTAFSNGVQLSRSETYRLYLPQAISLQPTDITATAKGKYVGLEISYSLTGTEEITANLSLSDSSSSYKQQIARSVVLKEGNRSIFVPSYFGLDSVHVTFVLQTNEDKDPSNDTLRSILDPLHFQIIPGLGISYDGNTADTLQLWGTDKLIAAASDTAWISLSPVPGAVESTSGVTFSNGANAYSLGMSSSSISAGLDSDASIFMKQPGIDAWQLLADSAGVAHLDHPGLLARGTKTSSTGPEVSLMIEGQLFFDGDYITGDSRVNLIGEDADGFTWNSEDIELLVDGSPVQVDLGDTTGDSQILGVSSDLSLSSGNHDISYRMRDALDNWSEPASISAIVANEAQIIDYGNFPNPFQGETQIIYELTQPLEDVQIEIFTLAGYKVITIDEFDARVGISLGAIGYHEVPWNGRDRNDDFVANGVYFYRITGGMDGETLHGPIGKMVKNR